MDWVEEFIAREGLPAHYARAVGDVVAPLASNLYRRHRRSGRPLIAGISGAQGSGKTTLAMILGEWLERELGLATACLSLDGLYLRKAERSELSQRTHPLLETRGVPGTHDVARTEELLDALVGVDHAQAVALPVFDKVLDDRAPASEWSMSSFLRAGAWARGHKRRRRSPSPLIRWKPKGIARDDGVDMSTNACEPITPACFCGSIC